MQYNKIPSFSFEMPNIKLILAGSQTKKKRPQKIWTGSWILKKHRPAYRLETFSRTLETAYTFKAKW